MLKTVEYVGTLSILDLKNEAVLEETQEALSCAARWTQNVMSPKKVHEVKSCARPCFMIRWLPLNVFDLFSILGLCTMLMINYALAIILFP